MTLAPARRPGRTIAAITVLFARAYGASLVVLAKPDWRIVFGDVVESRPGVNLNEAFTAVPPPDLREPGA